MDTSTNAVSRQLPRDVFLYLLMIFVLSASAISLGTLLFQFTNLYVPDVADSACMYGTCHNSIRTALAFLLIVFPILIWVMRFLQRDISDHPEKRELRIRRWLLYLTLFVAGLIVIGDLITLVNGYLRGDLTLRFILKVLSVLFIAGSIFFYYLRELRADRSRAARIVAVIVAGVVLAAVVWGLVISGSPTRQRDRRLDERRVTDLQLLQSQIVDRFWRSKSRLPSALSELQDDISGFSVPVDPESGDPYVYERLGELRFRLCATFALDSDGTDASYPRYWPDESWDHDAGEFCFDRTIDPDLYKPLQEVPAVR